MNSHLNLQLWHSLLTHYNDIQIVQFLAFGFPLDICNRDKFSPIAQITNHKSATDYSTAIDEYLNSEISHGAILGPFTFQPIPKLHCSPLLTRPKGPPGYIFSPKIYFYPFSFKILFNSSHIQLSIYPNI